MNIGARQLLAAVLLPLALGVCGVAFAGSENTGAGEDNERITGYTVGGTVTGLVTGASVTLQNNGSNNLLVDANGTFIFTYQLPDGATYDVTVLTQPASPDLFCSVTHGSGTITGANITDVQVDCDVPPHPTCPGGIGDEDALVTLYDYDSGGVIDCTAEDSITLGADVFVLKNTTLNLKSSLVSIQGNMAVEIGSQLHVLGSARIPLRLNDTGIIYCADDTSDGWICPISTHPGQDAEHGRDVTNNDDSDGHAGFSFTKLDANGAPLLAGATSWSCVRDNVTGLIWEVKTDDSGLHNKDNTYTWYNPDSSNNGGYEGYQNGGTCTGSTCDTQGYVQAVNIQGLCGANDWRMPNVKELENIASQDSVGPAIDTDYFPNTISSYYWSASPYAGYSSGAWYVYFGSGYSYNGYRSYDVTVRLVRGGQ